MHSEIRLVYHFAGGNFIIFADNVAKMLCDRPCVIKWKMKSKLAGTNQNDRFFSCRFQMSTDLNCAAVEFYAIVSGEIWCAANVLWGGEKRKFADKFVRPGRPASKWVQNFATNFRGSGKLIERKWCQIQLVGAWRMWNSVTFDNRSTGKLIETKWSIQSSISWEFSQPLLLNVIFDVKCLFIIQFTR